MNTEYYVKTTSEIDIVQLEREVLQYWQENKTFIHSVDRLAEKEFVFYDGPPFANGLPHYGHLLTGFIKDAFARYHTMLNKRVPRRFGWDCHGLPAEMATEKALGITGRKAIQSFGIEKFNAKCRVEVLKYTEQWEEYVTRQARWVDFYNSYKTMDLSFMESVLWAFKELYTKGLIYESVKVVPYSWACETPVANFETRMDNAYREKVSKAVTVKFPLKQSLRGKKAHLLAWTTTPWTLPSNLVLAISKHVTYLAVNLHDEYYVMSQEYYQRNKFTEQYIVLNPATELIGRRYQPLFPYFASHKAFMILAASFVTANEGTGIVHCAPGFGEDDFILCEKHGIPLVCPVDSSGRFTDEVSDFTGQHVFESNEEIVKYLKQKSYWFKTEQYIHNYPHCWRTDTPLIYKAVPSWYLKVTALKERMLVHNQQINWYPKHIRNGQFGKWLDNVRDWAISRSRFWGTPLPVWKSDDPQYPRIDIYGSIAELEHDFKVKIRDLHRPFIDTLTRPNPDDPTGKSTMRRISDVLDCWFESGAMPFAQQHYPFENKEWFHQHFPADFITEYIAQTRGWFYTLLILATGLFDRPPFKNCICHGVVLDTKGRKLSKRLNNYADPLLIFDKYGADSLRFLMLRHGVVHGEELLLDKEGKMVRDILRLVIKPIWNAVHFFIIYANADGVQARISNDSENLMDRYILAKCSHTITVIARALSAYNTVTACQALEDFFEVLNNWYIRLNRKRFWSTEQSTSKYSAYNTLLWVFYHLCRATAPLLPIVTEAIWQRLRFNSSVHLATFPENSDIQIDPLIDGMESIRDICNAALAIRNTHNLRVRQTLSTLYVYTKKDLSYFAQYTTLLQEEVNVKQVIYSNDIINIATLKLKPNFALLGKHSPSKIKPLLQAMQKNKWQKQEDNSVIVNDQIVLQEDEYELLLHSEQPYAKITASNDTVVVLNIEIDEELKIAGIAKDLVRLVQQTRKEANLHITTRIDLVFDTSSSLCKQAIDKWHDYIAAQTLANKISYTNSAQCAFTKHYTLAEMSIIIGLSKV